MNEQAIKDLYDLAVADGYGKGIEEFKTLLKTNETALADMYELSKSNGYTKSIDEFKVLVGANQSAKKKELPFGITSDYAKEKEPMVMRPQEEPMESSSEDGSSESSNWIQNVVSDSEERLGVQSQAIADYKAKNKRGVIDPKYLEQPEYTTDEFGNRVKAIPQVAQEDYLKKPTQQIQQKAKVEERLAKVEAETPEYLKSSIAGIPAMQEKGVDGFVSEMNSVFGDAGFKFDRSGIKLTMTAPDGTVETISYGFERPEDVRAQVEYFVKTKGAPLNNVEKIERLYKDENKKYITDYQVEFDMKEFAAEQDNIGKEFSTFITEKEQAEKTLRQLVDMPVVNRPQNYLDLRYQAENNLKRIGESGVELQAKIDKIKKKEASLKASIGKYVERQSKLGTISGATWNAAMDTIGGMVSGTADMIIDFSVETSPFSVYMSAEEKDKWKKNLKYGKEDELTYLEGARTAWREAFGSKSTTEQYEELAKQNFFTGAIIGVGGSLPAMIHPAAMYAAGNDAVNRIMENNPEFDNISEREKLLVKIPMGIAAAALEKAGLDDVLKNSGVFSFITSKIIAKAPFGATVPVFRKVAEKEVMDMIADGSMRVLTGTMGEGLTGAAQEMSNIAIQSMYNMAKDKNMFDTPDTVADVVYDILYSGAQEAIGGAIMTTPIAIANGFKEGNIAGIKPEYFEIFANMANDPVLEKSFIAKLKSDVIDGKITKRDATDLLNNYRHSVGLLRSMPEEITETGDKKMAMQLMRERKGLEEKIVGKDEAMAKPIKERIAAINEQLAKITENAIQKQATGEVPVQSETGVGQEMVEGVSESGSQVAPQETIITQEEKNKAGLVEYFSNNTRPTEDWKYNPDVSGDGVLAFMEQEQALIEAGADRIQAHGMNKGSIGSQFNDLINILTNGIDDRGGGALYTAPLAINPEDKAGAGAALGTGGGTAYIDGGFIILARPGVNTIRSIDDIGGVLVNEAVSESMPELVQRLRDTFPNISIDSYSNSVSVINNMNNREASSKETTKPSTTVKETIFTAATPEVKQGVTFMSQDGTEMQLDGNEEVAEQLYNEAVSIPEEQRTEQQQELIKGLKPVFLESQANKIDRMMAEQVTGEAVTDSEAMPTQEEVQFTEQDAARRTELQTALDTAGKNKRRDIYVGQKKMTRAEIKAEIEVLNQREQQAAAGKVETLDKLMTSAKQKESGKVRQAVSNAAKAIAKILPNVNIVVHESNDDYMAATGDTDGASGLYVPSDNGGTIHINLERANTRTVGHETFHAILLRSIKTDAEAQKLAKAMLNAVMKSLKQTGKNNELLQKIEEFASNYEENFQNEEKLAEIFGYLTDGYPQLPVPAKSAIRKFIDAIAKMFGFARMSDADIVDMMNTLSRKVAAGEEITESDVMASKSKIAEINKRFQANFTDPVSGLRFVYDKNDKHFEDLEKNGYITNDKSIFDFVGKFMLLHQPDAAFAGKIYKGDQLLVNGQGGMYYPVIFHDKNFFWASTDSAAKNMAKWLNEVSKQNGGTIYMALTSAPYDKLLSSTTMSNAVLDFFASKAFDDNFNISEKMLIDAVIKAANKKVITKKTNKETGEVTEKVSGLRMELKGNLSLNDIMESVKSKLSADNSIFADRKIFAETLIDEMAKYINKDKKAVDQFGVLFSDGIQNKYFKGIKPKKSKGKVVGETIKISKANMIQAISEMLTEPILKDGVDRKNGGQIYAILEVNGDIKSVKTPEHASYPMALKASGKTKIHILKDREKWSDVFEDPTTNELPVKKRLKKVYPSSGVSSGGKGLKVSGKNAPKKVGVSSRQQKSSPNKEAEKIVQFARTNGFDDEAIETLLKKKGFTDDVIAAAMGTEAKGKIEVSEGTLPGYDKLISKVEGVYERSMRRGATKEKALENAIASAETSPQYEAATDQQREQIIRNIREMFGKKEKKAPSKEKITGKPKPTKTTVNEAAALKDQIRLEVKAAREAAAWKKADMNGKRTILKKIVKDIAAKGKLSIKQVKAIINKISSVNLDSPDMMQRVIDYISKVFADADYMHKISVANKLRAKIKALGKNANKLGNLTVVAKRFAEIDPEMIDDIDAYIDMAMTVAEGVSGSRMTAANLDIMDPATGDWLNIRSKLKVANILDTSKAIDFITDAMEKQDEKVRLRLAEKVADATGMDTTGMTYDEMMDILKSLEVKPDERVDAIKDTEVRNTVTKIFEDHQLAVEDMLTTGINPVTGQPLNISEQDAAMIREFMGMDLSKLKTADVIRAVDMLNNFVTNGSIAGMGAIVGAYRGQVEIEALVDDGTKARKMKSYHSPLFARSFYEAFASLPLFFEKMFKGTTKAIKVMKAMGITSLVNHKAAAAAAVERVLDRYIKQFNKRKPNGKAFQDISNIIERGIIGDLGKTIEGSEKEIQAEFDKRKRIIVDSIDVLRRSGTKKDLEMASAMEAAYNKIARDSNNIDEVRAKADKINVDAVNFWINEWDKIYNELEAVTLSVYNRQLQRTGNYVPDRYAFTGDTKNSNNTPEDPYGITSSFVTNSNIPYKKSAGSLMEKEDTPDGLDVKAGKYVNLSFDSMNAQAMLEALIDVKTAMDVRQVKAFMDSDLLDKVVEYGPDREALKERVVTLIRNVKNKRLADEKTLRLLAKKMNRIANLGAALALAGPMQMIKQTVPLMFNTMWSAGVGNFFNGMKDVFSGGANKFINNSGMGIALRGIDSITELESLNRRIETTAKTSLGKAIRMLDRWNQRMLNIFLSKPDVLIARASWLAFYRKGLKKYGADPNIDWSTHEINQEAADYAQMMLDRKQNISDKDLAGTMYNSGKVWKEVALKVFIPFSTFRINQTARMGNDLTTMSSATASMEDKVIAARSMAGMLTEMAVFRTISIGASFYIFYGLANWLTGGEEDEEEINKKWNNLLKGAASSAVADLFSPIPNLDEGVKKIVNAGMSFAQDLAEVDEDEKYSLFTTPQETWATTYGMFGIAADRAQSLFDNIELYRTGKFKDQWGNEKIIPEKYREAIGSILWMQPFVTIGLIPAPEMNNVINNTIKIAKKEAKTQKQMDKEVAYAGYKTLDEFKKNDPDKYEKYSEEGGELYKYREAQKEDDEPEDETELKKAKRVAYAGYDTLEEYKKNDPRGYERSSAKGGDLYKYKELQKANRGIGKKFRGMSEEEYRKEYPKEYREKYGPGTEYHRYKRSPQYRIDKRKEAEEKRRKVREAAKEKRRKRYGN